MKFRFTRHQIAVAALAAIGATALGTASSNAAAGEDKNENNKGTYLTGDFHNHTTCSDGAISLQKLVKKATEKSEGNWGLDWFVQAGHGGNGNRNCTLVEDESLSTPVYPFLPGKGPNTTWADSIGAAKVKGNIGNTTTPLSTQANPSMWRWQSVQEFSYPVVEYLSALKGVPVFMGVESVVAGHEHTSMSVVTGQLPNAAYKRKLPATGPYAALGNATALSQWTYCFDRGDTDTSRGGGQGWDCSVPGSANAADPSWNATAAKLTNNNGVAGHQKTVEAVKWMAQFHAKGSYYVPAHLERAGPFNAAGANGFNVEHLRNFHNAGPDVAFGFETQPGHGASSNRGEYRPKRNNFGTTAAPVLVDSVGGTTFGGTGVYGAQVGGVWDALLGEGRNFWFFASSDWHNRGMFGPDDRRSTQDFQPGEYQRNFTMVKSADGKYHRDDDRDDKGGARQDGKRAMPVTPQQIVDGLRSGNNFAASGQLIDRLSFVVCTDRSASNVEKMVAEAAEDNSANFEGNCATMGEKLVVRPGAELMVGIAVRDPSGPSSSPYTFDNPSLKQIGVSQPLNMPVLDHIDVIRGMVGGYKQPGTADYAGEWPRGWLKDDGSTLSLASVPAAAKNDTAAVVKTFNRSGWKKAGKDILTMSFRIPAVQSSQYVRLRGTNLPAAVPYETDANGNPLTDLFTNENDTSKLKIPCTATGTTDFNGCPAHMATVNGQKYSSFDVAAWADLWFYSNPVYVQVKGSTTVAGVK
jgi:hypothetical protein